VPLLGLESRLKEERKKNPEVAIALQSDRRASFGLVVKVMDIARKAGFEQLPAFIQPEKAPTGSP
jgi:biopolymer transport protein ExbD